MEERQINLSRFTRVAENNETARQQQPQQQLRPQAEIERNPSWFQVRAENEGRSNWSGGVFGGRVDRSR
jgi:hypothetical protein